MELLISWTIMTEEKRSHISKKVIKCFWTLQFAISSSLFFAFTSFLLFLYRTPWALYRLSFQNVIDNSIKAQTVFPMMPNMENYMKWKATTNQTLKGELLECMRKHLAKKDVKENDNSRFAFTTITMFECQNWFLRKRCLYDLCHMYTRIIMNHQN